MNVVESLAYIRAGLLHAGFTPAQVLVAMELARPSNTDSIPSASVYSVVSRYTRAARRERIPASALREAASGATGGTRRSLMDGFTWYEVLITARTMADAQSYLTGFLSYLITTDLVDAAGKEYRVLSEGSEREKELVIQWNDHDQQDRVTCTFTLPLPGIVFQEHPRYPIDIEVQYRLEGGNDHE